MINETVRAYTDPLAGGYLWGWTLLAVGVSVNMLTVVLAGLVLIVIVLLIGGVMALVE